MQARAMRASSLPLLGGCLLASVLAHAVLLLVPQALIEDAKHGRRGDTSSLRLVSHVAPVSLPALPSPIVPARGPGGGTGSASVGDLPVVRTYWPQDSLEQLAMVVSAPNVSLLEGLHLPAEQVRLRLFIDELGRVNEVRLLGEGYGDWSAVRRMFEATAFIPARREGREVASTLDLEIDIRDLVREL